MGTLQELLKDVVQSGPGNIKRFMSIAEKLPSDSTLQQLNTTINSLIPHIPQLESILGDGNIKNMERLLKKIPDSKTLDRLASALPMLERLPDKETLGRLLNKADSLQGLLDSLEGGGK